MESGTPFCGRGIRSCHNLVKARVGSLSSWHWLGQFFVCLLFFILFPNKHLLWYVADICSHVIICVMIYVRIYYLMKYVSSSLWFNFQSKKAQGFNIVVWPVFVFIACRDLSWEMPGILAPHKLPNSSLKTCHFLISSLFLETPHSCIGNERSSWLWWNWMQLRYMIDRGVYTTADRYDIVMHLVQ